MDKYLGPCSMSSLRTTASWPSFSPGLFPRWRTPPAPCGKLRHLRVFILTAHSGYGQLSVRLMFSPKHIVLTVKVYDFPQPHARRFKFKKYLGYAWDRRLEYDVRFIGTLSPRQNIARLCSNYEYKADARRRHLYQYAV